MFSNLTLKGWRQFSDVNIDFHPRLTIITGANGSGKTTLLSLLSQCVGWNPAFVSSYRENEQGFLEYNNGLDATGGEDRRVINMSSPRHPSSISFGKLTYLRSYGGYAIEFFVQSSVWGGIYPIDLISDNQRRDTNVVTYGYDVTAGVYIHSHRPIFPYRNLSTIPTSVETRGDIYRKYVDFRKKFIQSKIDRHHDTATLLIKQSLAALAIYGEGNSVVAPNRAAKQLFDGYVEILKKTLPPKLGFKKIKVAMPEVLLCTETGDFPLDAISGGISSIIDITWQLYLLYEDERPFVALIDEPENHLHPEMQKSFMGNLIKAFPNVQFVIATHNPLMISSQKDSHVYVLDYDENNKVRSTKLDYVNRAGTANAILREVLGLDSSMPQWAEEELRQIIEKYQSMEITGDALDAMRSELKEIGLEDYIPKTIADVIGGKTS